MSVAGTQHIGKNKSIETCFGLHSDLIYSSNELDFTNERALDDEDVSHH